MEEPRRRDLAVYFHAKSNGKKYWKRRWQQRGSLFLAVGIWRTFGAQAVAVVGRMINPLCRGASARATQTRGGG